jgi:hypothetical protein
VNLTAWHNSAKRVETVKRQIVAASVLCVPHEQFRQPSLNHFTGQKKSIMELAAICGLTYKDGKVG